MLDFCIVNLPEYLVVVFHFEDTLPLIHVYYDHIYLHILLHHVMAGDLHVLVDVYPCNLVGVDLLPYYDNLALEKLDLVGAMVVHALDVLLSLDKRLLPLFRIQASYNSP